VTYRDGGVVVGTSVVTFAQAATLSPFAAPTALLHAVGPVVTAKNANTSVALALNGQGHVLAVTKSSKSAVDLTAKFRLSGSTVTPALSCSLKSCSAVIVAKNKVNYIANVDTSTPAMTDLSNKFSGLATSSSRLLVENRPSGFVGVALTTTAGHVVALTYSTATGQWKLQRPHDTLRARQRDLAPSPAPVGHEPSRSSPSDSAARSG
jgi:hypothetical protein